MKINQRFDFVDGSFETDSGKLECVINRKYSSVDLCFCSGMLIPFAAIKLYSSELAIDADAVVDDAFFLGKEIVRRWNGYLSPQHGGNIPKKDRSPISMLKTYTPDAAPESQYPPATEQPEEECSVPKDCVVDLRADSFASVCQVVTENQVLQAKLAASEARVKALEEALTPSVETKAAFMSEFSFRPSGYIANKYTDEIEMVIVPWITIKEIMKAIRERAEATCQK